MDTRSRSDVFQAVFFEFETSKLGSVKFYDYDYAQINHVTIKFYDVNNSELTTQETIDSDCVYSIVDYKPDFDYQLSGGSMQHISQPTEDVFMWVRALPDIAAPTGQKDYVYGGLNLRMVSSGQRVDLDSGKVMFLPYNNGYGTNLIRFKFRHIAGFKHRAMVALFTHRS